MKLTTGIVSGICAAVLLCAPAHAGIILSIQPSTVMVSPGDIGDSFDVVLDNTGPSSVSVAQFSFEVSAASSAITLTSADFSTVLPYIFAGDSFDVINSFALNTTSGQTLDGSDLTNDSANVTILSGHSFGLGHVLFNVAGNATAGPVAITFTGGSNSNNLSDNAENLVTIDTLTPGSIDISAVPEPAAFGLVGVALFLLGGFRHARGGIVKR